MPDAFFASSKQRKRKRPDSAQSSRKLPRKENPKSVNRSRPKRSGDEELDSDHTNDDVDIDDLELAEHYDDPGASGEEDNETPAEKRLRLAQLYLDSVKEGLAEGEFDAAEIDKELISARLQKDVMEHSGKMHLFVADTLDFTQAPAVLRTRGHRFSVTSAVASESGQHLFTSGKEGSIIKWDLASGKRLETFFKVQPPTTAKGKGKQKSTTHTSVEGHTDSVLALAISSDGKYLASAGKDRRIGVWDAEKGVWMTAFIGQVGHKDVVSAISFRKGTHQLYTGSYDRTLKVYDLTPGVMGYVETLFGHQDHVLSLDALRGETCISVGGRDKTVRYWKIADETQLVFRGGGRSKIRDVLDGGLKGEDDEEDEKMEGTSKPKEKSRKFIEGSMECVAMIDETTFVSGGDSGSLCLWSTQKKKPVFTQPIAHGLHETQSATEGVVETPRWITAVASLRYSDLIASGSWDGDIRIWKLDAKLKSFELVGTVPAPGVVNSLQFLTPTKDLEAEWATSGRSPLLVVGLGKEHRLGRWWNIKDGFNGSMVFSFPRTS
ncbi:WD-REPEATS-REGION domain-containing protein [Mycena indigotica]|uniref:WD-REPEATS-REGION domain-containing protein n=1 Tax=Mycena indigotica TaxID=2126181 RepID=A0A8H6WG09_9AGAR|nr:WD-REPEATS-REGION domain-containing protein [Mycena indigotica]KAF7315331.1 WD-REPEATS-REGION domain-containing protein [Mycena indigotica]